MTISRSASSTGVGAPGQRASSCARISARGCQISAGMTRVTPEVLVDFNWDGTVTGSPNIWLSATTSQDTVGSTLNRGRAKVSCALSGLEKVRIGCSGWSYKDWVGPFYPPGTEAKDYLRLYSRTF